MDIITLALILVVIGLIAYYVSYRLSHFDRLGLPYDKPLPILGNMGRSLFRIKHIAYYMQNLYERFSDYKYFGFFDFINPVIMVRDPELISTIAIKNFDNFTDHRGFVDEKLDPLMGQNLFSLRGDYWREMRKLISPVFTSSKLKQMHGLICHCAEKFANHVANDVKRGKVIDMKEIISRYTNDVVATTAFGIEIDSMRDPKNDFYVLGREALNFDSILSIKFMLGKNFSFFMKLFGIRLFSQRVQNFFENVVDQTVRLRKEKGIYRPDLIQLMMETKGKNGSQGLSASAMTCQAFVFFFAGFDTTASALSLLVYELAINPDIKERLRTEIEDVLRESNGKPSYDDIHQMKYMDAVINESLRLHPLANFLDRLCVKEFELPPAVAGAKPIKLKPGDTVWFPVYPIHRDPQYYPNPDKFDPERFLDTQPDPLLFLPFGIGPRFCIGNRFALAEMKIFLFYFLARCDLLPTDKTTSPLKYNRKNFQLAPENGFSLMVKELENSLLSSQHRVSNNGTTNGAANAAACNN